eukprot:TRINITY_DN5308_c0_g2_i1.p1 TRINITY_DN5308_c0_g2~~TRINITY_DN5308_c0_g2_i1.p1  ORF type:complete len:167 (+),score=31.75 TRINITY_DN5308_c0_g2_i1:38-502(+)
MAGNCRMISLQMRCGADPARYASQIGFLVEHCKQTAVRTRWLHRSAVQLWVTLWPICGRMGIFSQLLLELQVLIVSFLDFPVANSVMTAGQYEAMLTLTQDKKRIAQIDGKSTLLAETNCRFLQATNPQQIKSATTKRKREEASVTTRKKAKGF